jgi:hypothetical protein
MLTHCQSLSGYPARVIITARERDKAYRAGIL